jgi:hypothetical protein
MTVSKADILANLLAEAGVDVPADKVLTVLGKMKALNKAQAAAVEQQKLDSEAALLAMCHNVFSLVTEALEDVDILPGSNFSVAVRFENDGPIVQVEKIHAKGIQAASTIDRTGQLVASKHNYALKRSYTPSTSMVG